MTQLQNLADTYPKIPRHYYTPNLHLVSITFWCVVGCTVHVNQRNLLMQKGSATAAVVVPAASHSMTAYHDQLLAVAEVTYIQHITAMQVW